MNSILEKKKKAENELEAMVKDLKEKLDKYDQDKKSVLKGEKNKRDAVSAKLESEKKDLEEKLENISVSMRYINNNVFQVHILLHEIQTLKDLCKKNFFRKICQIHFEIERHFLKSRSIELHYTFFGDLCADLDPCLEG